VNACNVVRKGALRFEPTHHPAAAWRFSRVWRPSGSLPFNNAAQQTI
jgi:hypothetical protein